MALQTATDRRLVPTVIEKFRGLTIHLFGRPCELGRIMDPETREALAQYAGVGVKKLCAVDGSQFNGSVILTEPLNFSFFSTHGNKALTFYYGAFADGLVLGPDEAYVLRSGDCHTVVLTDGKVHVAAHAGRDSVLGNRWRSDGIGVQPSVITNALAKFRDPSQVYAMIVCGIGPGSFIHDPSHSEHGANNAVLIREVTRRWGSACFVETFRGMSLSMPGLIRAQLIEGGVSESHIAWDGIDTASDSTLWASQSRGDKDRTVVLVTHSPSPS